MSEHRERHVDLCAAYALGSLDPADRRLLEEHLALGCAVCEAALVEFSAGVVLLAASTPPVRPSAALKGRVMAAVRADRLAPGEATEAPATNAGDAVEEEPRPAAEAPRRLTEIKPRRSRVYLASAWAIAASFALIAGLLWTTSGRLRQQLVAAREDAATLRQRLAEEERWAAVLNAPGARLAVLTLAEADSAGLKARAVYDPSMRRALLVFENVTPPAGGDYELWAIRSGVPASLGVIKADATGRAVVRVEDAGETGGLSAFAVSLEPEGGAPGHAAPTGPFVMSGALSR